MKAFIEHNQNGLLYREGGEWVRETERALAFTSTAEAEHFRKTKRIPKARAVFRLDPFRPAKPLARAPGAYQMGE